jgi:hypothetical protein
MNHILAPVFALVALTFLVLFRTGFVRIRALRQKRVDPKYFRALQGEPPPEILNPPRNLANLFEMPVLFYLAAILIWNGRLTDPAYLALAWSYVALRYLHSAIHLTSNRVTRRFSAFALSLLPLLAIWGRLAFQLI